MPFFPLGGQPNEARSVRRYAKSGAGNRGNQVPRAAFRLCGSRDGTKQRSSDRPNLRRLSTARCSLSVLAPQLADAGCDIFKHSVRAKFERAVIKLAVEAHVTAAAAVLRICTRHRGELLLIFVVLVVNRSVQGHPPASRSYRRRSPRKSCSCRDYRWSYSSFRNPFVRCLFPFDIYRIPRNGKSYIQI